jgi:hypothetical protein
LEIPMTIQLPQSARPGVRPTESARPDGVEPAALVGAAPARTSRYAELRTYQRLSEAAGLSRVRVTVDDRREALEKLAGQLAPQGGKILSLAAHPNFRGVRNGLNVSAPEQVDASDLVAAAHAAGTTEVRAWPTTALALVYSSTRALALAAPVSENPREHPSEIPDVVEVGNPPGLSEAAFQPGTGPRWRPY